LVPSLKLVGFKCPGSPPVFSTVALTRLCLIYQSIFVCTSFFFFPFPNTQFVRLRHDAPQSCSPYTFLRLPEALAAPAGCQSSVFYTVCLPSVFFLLETTRISPSLCLGDKIPVFLVECDTYGSPNFLSPTSSFFPLKGIPSLFLPRDRLI